MLLYYNYIGELSMLKHILASSEQGWFARLVATICTSGPPKTAVELVVA